MNEKPDLVALRGHRSQQEIADAVGVSRSLIAAVERGEKGVGLKLALGLERLYGIPPSTWVDDLPQCDPTAGLTPNKGRVA